ARPRSQRGCAPPAVALLLGERGVDDRLALFLRENTLNSTGCPQHHHPIEQAHRIGAALEIAAKQRQTVLYVRTRRILTGCGSDGDRRERRAKVCRSVALP